MRTKILMLLLLVIIAACEMDPMDPTTITEIDGSFWNNSFNELMEQYGENVTNDATTDSYAENLMATAKKFKFYDNKYFFYYYYKMDPEKQLYDRMTAWGVIDNNNVIKRVKFIVKKITNETTQQTLDNIQDFTMEWKGGYAILYNANNIVTTIVVLKDGELPETFSNTYKKVK